VDLLQAGILNAEKVARPALQDVTSVVGLLVTTEAMVAELPKEAALDMPVSSGTKRCEALEKLGPFGIKFGRSTAITPVSVVFGIYDGST
jgi:hypothetical protein